MYNYSTLFYRNIRAKTFSISNDLQITSSSLYCYRQIYELRHEISNNVVCATSKASDQPSHTRSLIRAFACC